MLRHHQRNVEMDIIRGIGIVLVVMLHVGIPSIFWSNYFNLFHMAIFFFSAGWCFNGKLLEERKGCIKFFIKKLKSLYIPYVVFNGSMFILNNFFIRINVYTDKIDFLEENIGIGNAFGLKNMYSLIDLFHQIISVVLGGRYGESQLGGATWFLRVLFIVTIVFFLFLKVIHSVREKFNIILNEVVTQIVVAAMLLLIGWEASKNDVANYYQLFTCASIYFVYVIGWLVRKLDILVKLKKYNLVTVLVAVVSGGFLFVIGLHASVSVNSNSYTNPFWLISASTFGSMLCLSIAILLGKGPDCIVRMISYIGKNSLSIMMYHFLAFKIVTLIQIYYYDRPKYLLAAFPVLNATGIWRCLYIVAGIYAPILLHAVYKYIIKGIMRLRDKYCMK